MNQRTLTSPAPGSKSLEKPGDAAESELFANSLPGLAIVLTIREQGGTVRQAT
jgi:hypothetical protein